MLQQVFMNPAANQPQRLPAFPNVEQSAVVALRQTTTASVIMADTGSVGTRMAIHRQPSMPLWVDQNLTTGWLWGVECGISATGDPVAGPIDTYSGTVSRDLGGLSDGTTATSVSPGGTTVSFKWRCLGNTMNKAPLMGAVQSDDRPFTFIPSIGGNPLSTMTAIMVLSTTVGTLAGFDAAANGGYVQLVFERWIAPGRTLFDTRTVSVVFTQIAGTTASATVVSTMSNMVPGFYRFSSVALKGSFSTGDNPPDFFDIAYGYAGAAPTYTNATTTVTVSPSQSIAFLPATPAAEASTTTAHLQGCRCTALALSASNVTAIMNKEGVVTAGRMAPTELVFSFWKQDLATLPPVKRYQGPLESGFHIISPPLSDLDTWLDFAGDFTTATSYGTEYPYYNLSSPAEVIAVNLADPTTTTLSSLALQLDMHLEFRCYSQLWPSAMSRRTIEELHRAIVDVVQKGFCFPGPTNTNRRSPKQAVLAVAPAPRPVNRAKGQGRAEKQKKRRMIGPMTRAQNDRIMKRREKRAKARAAKR